MVRKIAAALLAAAVAGCGDAGGRAEARVERPPVATATTPVVLFVGTSLTAGLGVDPDSAYPALVQAMIDSAGLDYRVVNAGVSGETSAGGLRRLDWLLRQPVAVLVLELGANDGLRGLDVSAMQDNLRAAIDKTRAAHPDARVVVAGMEAPPNLGRDYTTAFRRAFGAIAEERDVALVPFLLAGVGGVPELNQPDGIHPTPAGHRVIAGTVWRVLGPVLVGERR